MKIAILFALCATAVATGPTQADAPTALTAGTVGSSTAVISWSPAANTRGCSFKSYQVEVEPTNSPGTWAANAGCQGLTSESTRHCTLTGLKASTSYTVHISTVCAVPAATSFHNSLRFKTKVGPVRADMPTLTTMGTVTSPNNPKNTAKLNWVAGANLNGCSFAHYQVEVKGATGTWAANAGCKSSSLHPVTTLTCTLTGLTGGYSYTARIRTVCADPAANSYHNSRYFTTAAVTDTITASVKIGGNELPVRHTQDFTKGCLVVIAKGKTEEESNEITGYGSLLLKYPLKFPHPPLTTVEQSNTGSPPAKRLYIIDAHPKTEQSTPVAAAGIAVGVAAMVGAVVLIRRRQSVTADQGYDEQEVEEDLENEAFE